MRVERRWMPALFVVAILVALSVPAVANRALGATSVLDGSITADDATTWSSSAVAVVTLVDITADPEAGAILGQQRIDAAGAAPLAFEVPYESDRVQSKHAYAAYATVIDGDAAFATLVPVPVLTGGPSTGVELGVEAVPTYPASISGAVTPPAGTDLSDEAVTTEVLIKQETGTLAGVRTFVETDAQIAYEVGYEPDLVDPAATYVAS